MRALTPQVVRRARWWRIRLAAAIAMVGALTIFPSASSASTAAQSRATATISPSTNLINQEFVTVSWAGYPKTRGVPQGGSPVPDAVAVYECVANPPGGVYYYYRDCFTAGAPNAASGFTAGVGNAVDPKYTNSAGITGADGTGSVPFEVQQGTLHTTVANTVASMACSGTKPAKTCMPDFNIQCDTEHPCVLKVLDLTAEYLRVSTFPNPTGTSPSKGTWSQVVDDAPSVPLRFAPVANCPPPSTGNPNVAMTGAPSSQYAVQSWAAQLCTGTNKLTLDYTPLTEEQAKRDFAGGLAPVALASLAPASGPPGSGVLSAPTDLSGTSIAFNLATPTGQVQRVVRLTPRLAAMLLTNSGIWANPSDNPAPAPGGKPIRELFDDPEFKALNPDFTPPSQGLYGPLILAGARDDVSIITKWIADDADAKRFLAGKDPCAGLDQYWQGASYPSNQFFDMAPTPNDPFPVTTGTAAYSGAVTNTPSGGLAISSISIAGHSAMAAPGPRVNNITGLGAAFTVGVTNNSSNPITDISGYTSEGPVFAETTTVAPGTTVELAAFGQIPGLIANQQTVPLHITANEQGVGAVASDATIHYVGGDGASPGTALSVSDETINGEPADAGPGLAVSKKSYTGSVTLTNTTDWPVGGIVATAAAGTGQPPFGPVPLVPKHLADTTLNPHQSATYTWKGSTIGGSQSVQVVFQGAGPSPVEGNDYRPILSNQTVAQNLQYDLPNGAVSFGSSAAGIMGVVDTATANETQLPSAALDAASPTSQLSQHVNTKTCQPKQVTDFSGFQAPTATSLNAGAAAMTAGPNGSLVPPVATTDPAAYPLTKIDYSFVPSKGLDASTAANVATFLRYASGPGQSPKVLPPSYPPLPAWLSAQTLAVANQVAQEGKGGTTPAGGPGPGPGGTGESLGLQVPFSSASPDFSEGLSGSPDESASAGSGDSGAGASVPDDTTDAGGGSGPSSQAHRSGPASGKPRLAGAKEGPVDTAGGSWLTGAWLLPLIAGLIVLFGGAGFVFRVRSRPPGGGPHKPS